MLFAAVDDVLGTRTKVQVIRALLPHRQPVTGREVERLSRTSSRSALRKALEQLSAAGVLARRELSGVHLYEINRDHDLLPGLEALFHVEADRFAALRSLLDEELREAGVRERVVSVIVFGSMARGDADEDSDLDLLVVVAEQADAAPVEDALLDIAEPVRARFGFRISPLVLSRGRVGERARDGDPLMRNVLDEGRTLLGLSFREVAGAW